MTPEQRAEYVEAGRELARTSRAEQGLPPHVEDEATLAKVAAAMDVTVDFRPPDTPEQADRIRKGLIEILFGPTTPPYVPAPPPKPRARTAAAPWPAGDPMRLSSDNAVPHASRLVTYLWLDADGSMSQTQGKPEKRAMLERVLAAPDAGHRLLLAWTGQWRTDIFVVDDPRDALAALDS